MRSHQSDFDKRFKFMQRAGMVMWVVNVVFILSIFGSLGYLAFRFGPKVLNTADKALDTADRYLDEQKP